MSSVNNANQTLTKQQSAKNMLDSVLNNNEKILVKPQLNQIEATLEHLKPTPEKSNEQEVRHLSRLHHLLLNDKKAEIK